MWPESSSVSTVNLAKNFNCIIPEISNFSLWITVFGAPFRLVYYPLHAVILQHNLCLLLCVNSSIIAVCVNL